MLSRDKKQSLRINQANTKQRFAIRKLTIGAASVLLGLAFLGVSSNQAHAAEESQTATTAQTSTSKPATANEDVTLANNDAQKDLANTDKALISNQGNTTQPNKINGQGSNDKITNVPSDGKVEYDYSISAKNDKTGKVEEVHSAASGKDNKATLVIDNSSDIEAHLSLTNTSDQDEFIGNNDWGRNTDPTKYNDDEAMLYINALKPGQQSLQINGDIPATITYLKDGQQINNDSMTVYYLDRKAGQKDIWYTYDQFVTKNGKAAIKDVKEIGFKGNLKAGMTAIMNVPLVYNPTSSSDNQISTQSYNAKSINVTTQTQPEKAWSLDEIADEMIHPTVRNADGSYSEIPEETEIANALPRAGQVVTISKSGNVLDQSGKVLYQGGHYHINLAAIQAVLQKYGYSVEPSAANIKQVMSYYDYTAHGGAQINKNAGSASVESGKFYFYIEVHKILTTKNTSFEEGSAAAQNFKTTDLVTTVNDVKNPTAVSVGHAFQDVAADKGKVAIVSIKDQTGKAISAINGSTPAGTYTITYAYKLNDSDDPAMLITKTATVTITPVSAPAVPDQPIVPSTPDEQPTTPSDNNNVQPKPEEPADSNDNGDNGDSDEETVAPKAQSDHAKKSNKVNKSVSTSAKSNVKVASVKNSAKIAKTTQAEQASLPQTGEKQNSLALIGLALASIASIFAIGASRKHN